MPPKTIEDKVIARIYGKSRGYVFTPKDFLHLGNHESVRQALARLTAKGTIRRLMRGIYDYPAFSAFLNAPASPDPDGIAQAIARANGWTIHPTGATALNLLGLSTQVPAQWTYLTDGPTKNYKWQGGTLKFRHRTSKEAANLSRETELVVQSLKALGKERVNDSVIRQIKLRLTPKERDRALKEARYAASWVYEVIKRIATEDGLQNA